MHKCETLSQVSCTNDLLNEDGDSELLHYRKESIMLFAFMKPCLALPCQRSQLFHLFDLVGKKI